MPRVTDMRVIVTGICVLAAVLTGQVTGQVSAAGAVPVIPNDVPGFPAIVENPSIRVTFADGSAIDGRAVHRGDILLVHGSGFDPGANRGGYPFPIPPGQPNGVYALYSAFPQTWQPSADAPADTRTHPHDRMAWLITPEALGSIPRVPIDMYRSIARVAQPMGADGTFTATVVVDPPATTPGDRWGIYVYPAAGAVNAAEELFIPIDYSTEPGLLTPPEPTADLILDASGAIGASAAAGGSVTARDGAQRLTDGRVAFSRSDDAADGVIRYVGTVTATARYNAVEVALADPWIEHREDTTVLTALVSTGPNVGADEMRRIEITPLSTTDLGTQPSRIGTIERHR